MQEPFLTELTNVEAKGKDPDKAWTDAVAAAKQVGGRLGVTLS
jgi:cellobiose transport system substrate-binding protein